MPREVIVQLGQMNALAMGFQLVPGDFEPSQSFLSCQWITLWPAGGDPGFPFRLAMHKAARVTGQVSDNPAKLLAGDAASLVWPSGHGVVENVIDLRRRWPPCVR